MRELQRFCTVYDAARILGISPQAVNRMVNVGLLAPAGILERGVYLLPRDVVEQLAMERATRVAPTPVESLEHEPHVVDRKDGDDVM